MKQCPNDPLEIREMQAKFFLQDGVGIRKGICY